MEEENKSNKFILVIVLAITLIVIVVVSILYLAFKTTPTTNENSKVDTEDSDEEETNSYSEEINSKLEQLDYVNEEVSYFKMDYLDRYLAYKEENPTLSNEKIILYVNIGLDNDFYTEVSDSLRQNTNLILVNKYYSLNSDYIPNDLTDIDSSYQVGGKQMTKDAASAFNEMARAAKEEGYNIRAVSTYRSYEYQTSLYNRYVSNDGQEKADTYSARAGYSEHQTGLAVDIDNISSSYTSFGSTKEFTWMKENCYKYGFILRYTEENEFITGYKNEPWHYRYVGVEVATKMYEENISSYEEYYFMYLDNE